MANAEKTILIYGLSPMQLLQLNSLAEPLGIAVRAVPDSKAACKVDELLSDKEPAPVPAMHLMGRFALLDGFNGQEQLATALINKVSPGVIKAVHTVHNGSWRFCDLCAELSSEHRTMTKRG